MVTVSVKGRIGIWQMNSDPYGSGVVTLLLAPQHQHVYQRLFLMSVKLILVLFYSVGI